MLTRKRESEISFDIEESPFDLHHTQDQEYTDLESYSKKNQTLSIGRVLVRPLVAQRTRKFEKVQAKKTREIK